MDKSGTQKTGSKANKLVLNQTFNVGGLTLRYYSVFLVSAIIIGYVVGMWRGKKSGYSSDFLENLFFWLIVNSFIAARIYYVLFYFDAYKNNLSEIYKVWHGGLAIYGAIIGGILTLLYFSRKAKTGLFGLLDIVAFAMPLSQALGRFGNYFNYEAFGSPTDLPWKMFVPENFRPLQFEQYSYFHPTFLYEAIWNVLVFFVLLAVSKKNPKPGMIAGVYLLAYSLGRFFIESIRVDSAFFGHFRGDQLTAAFIILLSLAIMVKSYASQSN